MSDSADGNLRDAVAVTADADGTLARVMSPAWSNGAGMFGGYLAATLLSAALHGTEQSGYPVITLAATLLAAPKPTQCGTLTVRRPHAVRLVRCTDVDLRVGPRLMAQGTVTSVVTGNDPVDYVAAPDELGRGGPVETPAGVSSLDRFDFRRVTRAGEPLRGTVWVRLAERWWPRDAPWPAIAVAATLDLTFPGRGIESPADISGGRFTTVQLTTRMVAPVTTEWCRIEVTTVARNGPVVVLGGRLLDTAGRMCATMEQTALTRL
ncbi:MAG TPA: acyl-CoA thioesterase domain-containing protein [Pseudonocardiaceae bacterium]|nr:acyl-CoA thioesterase domain-containing protein [Pseudonocardiaceae bacterium]